MYNAFNVMKFETINTYLTANYMFRYCSVKIPEPFHALSITKNEDIQDHATRSAQHFHITRVKSDMGKTGIG